MEYCKSNVALLNSCEKCLISFDIKANFRMHGTKDKEIVMPTVKLLTSSRGFIIRHFSSCYQLNFTFIFICITL